MLGFGISELSVNRARGFSPISLRPLAWYDPSDRSTLFQDVDGTVPVTSDFDPVAQIRDKSGLGHHMIQPDGTRRAVFREENGVCWLETDGTDDSYQLPSRMGLSANPGISVIAAIQPLSLSAPVQRVFHLGGDNEAGSLGCALGGDGYSWRFNNGNTKYVSAQVGQDIVATWTRPESSTYADSALRLDGTQIAVSSSANGAFLPVNNAQQAALFGHGSLISDAAHLRFYGMIVLRSVDPDGLRKCETWLRGTQPS